ncbi:Mysoin-binding motif of peroxisomes-domain-containing protein [Dissophora ornata]|nr:Mysoin-binding motif of peroxisomes-domain-containing protein [Dissophora ornata]
MADIVVYEDSPLAQYLQGEQQYGSDLQHATHTFSSSATDSEDAEFEERFKYFICTSPFLNRSVTLHSHERGRRTDVPATVDYTSKFNPGRFGYALGLGALAMLVARSALARTRAARLPNIQSTQNQALRSLQLLVNHCQSLDAKVNRAIMVIQEIELVSRGYRLSTPLAPISRIEQASKTRRCNMVRAQLVAALAKSGALFQRSTETLQSHIDHKRLSTLLDMYNITPSPRPSSPVAPEMTSLERLRKNFQRMHGHRREFLCELLSIRRKSRKGRQGLNALKDYDQNWTVVRDVLQEGVAGIESLVDELSKVLDSELCKIDIQDDSNVNSAQDKQIRPFVHRIALLEQHIRGVQAKLFICNEDIRETVQQESADVEKRRLLELQFDSISQDISMMASEWQHGKTALTQIFEPSVARAILEEQASLLLDEQDGHGLDYDNTHTTGPVIDSMELLEDQQRLMDLAAKREETWEASTETELDGFSSRRAVVFTGPDGVKMTRAERIQHQKLLREQEELRKERTYDNSKMVHELKDVLGRRRHLRENDDDQQQMATSGSSFIPTELPSSSLSSSSAMDPQGYSSTTMQTTQFSEMDSELQQLSLEQELALYSGGSSSFATTLEQELAGQVEESSYEISGVGEAEEDEMLEEDQVQDEQQA